MIKERSKTDIEGEVERETLKSYYFGFMVQVLQIIIMV